MRQVNQKFSRVVITGMGAITALGQGITSLKKGLKKGYSLFNKNPLFPELSFPVISAAIDNFNLEEAVSGFNSIPEELKLKVFKTGRRSPKAIQISLITVLEAYQQAKILNRSVDPTRIGLVVAGQNTTQRYSYDLFSSFQEEPSYLSPTYALHFMDTDQVGTLSEVFNIQGEGFNVGGASASGNIALIQAYRMIQQKTVDICLVVGVMADLSPLEVQGFHNIGAMGGKYFAEFPSKASRPFDSNHEGFIWGQGSGCLILESQEIADHDGISSLGEMKGTAIALDAHRYSEPNVLGESRVMQQAIAEAGMVPEDIHYLNTHGSGSIVGDETEVKAIHEVFKDLTNQVWLNATKGLIGHCLWSAGILEAITTLIQMQEGFLHPNLNLENPIDTSLRWVGKQAESVEIKTALSNSFGFGGMNSSVLLLRGE